MIFFMMDLLSKLFDAKIPAVFSYFSTRMMLAALTSLLISLFLGPLFIKKLYALKIGQSIRTEHCPLLGQLHEKKKDTPTMGGVLILFSMLISMFLWMDLTHIFTLILFITTVSLGFLGAYDDFLKLKYKNPKGVAARKKILVQVTLSILLALYLLIPSISHTLHMGDWYAPPTIKEVNTKINSLETTPHDTTLSLKDYATRLYIPFFKEHVFTFTGILIVGAAFWIVFVITGWSNAANLTDGLDGLATGSLIIVAACLALIAFISNHLLLARYLNILYIEGSGEIAIYLSAFVGACLGFLWYNSHPAQVFMGDTGSLALGGIIGVSAVLLKRELLLGLVGGIFVVETLSVILQVGSFKLRNKKRIFLCTPIHHHFEYKGWAETKVVTRFWIIGLLLAIIGIASLKFQ